VACLPPNRDEEETIAMSFSLSVFLAKMLKNDDKTMVNDVVGYPTHCIT
jgi:hypothetical protein